MIFNTRLPSLEGSHKVGTCTLVWTSGSHYSHGLMVKVWYPCEDVSSSNPSVYMSSGYIDYMHKININSVPAWLVHQFFSNVTTNSIQDAPPKQQQFPVILFSHGLFGIPEIYSVYCEYLASCGFVVFSPYHTDGSSLHVAYENHAIPHNFPTTTGEELMSFRRKQLMSRIQDMKYIIDKIYDVTKKQEQIGSKLANSIDVSKIGAAGHSFGGGTVTALALSDNRVSAAVPLDSWFEPIPKDIVSTSKLTVPIFVINSEKWQWELNLQLQQQVLKNAEHAELYYYVIPESMHQNFSDIAVIMPTLGKIAKQLGGDPVSMIKHTNSVMAAFFRRILSNNDDKSLDKYKIKA